MALSRVSFLFSFLCLPAVGSCSRTWRCAGRQLFLCVRCGVGCPPAARRRRAQGWMAEWSKAGDSSSLLFGGVGSNPTPVKMRQARSLVAPRRACHFFPEPPPGPYGGCVAQWQSIGLQILRSPVRLWSHPEEGRPFCFGFIYVLFPRGAPMRAGPGRPPQPRRSGGGRSYLLGLLAKIKCSICSYQLNLWYVTHGVTRV